MSPTTLFTTARTSIPVFKSFRQTIPLGRAVYTTSRSRKRDPELQAQRTAEEKGTKSGLNLGSQRTTLTSRTTRATPSLKDQLTTYLHHHPPISPIQTIKMSFLLPGLRRGLILSTPLILSAPLLTQHYRTMQPIRCDGPDPFSKLTSGLTNNYASEARTPIITESGAANPRAIRQ
ncbi:hypothetical protein CC86DRAFT_58917 [Ophiobolus disseminans]|uniref:Uncharacterized protein n=1 Tax=Ophiobolus disseminans TaxID=1469910 RepID=A0A6A6ZSE8_9PLEO|nr:hypothetical protein CC86DRAFT_58917 [Ophiobolus disseminans]